jgi:hypothetical protein
LSHCIQFSEIDRLLDESRDLPLCLADTSFLIAISDEDHIFHEEAQFLCEKFSEHNMKLFVSVTARSEFIDYHRRVIITETLMDMLAPTSKWKISSTVRDVLKTQRGWIDNQARSDNEPYLSDSRIKICKQAFLPKTQSGHIGWTELCKEYLAGRLFTAWESVSNTLDLNYIDMRADDVKELFRKELHWDSMYRLAEESALGSQDAMILNLFDCSILPFVVTMDFDLAYGALQSTQDKVALVPDNLYRNRFKKLKL